MVHKKCMDVLWIYDYIMTHKKITSGIIYSSLSINERQLWRYMADIKQYYKKYTEYELIYSKKTKEYSLTPKE